VSRRWRRSGGASASCVSGSEPRRRRHLRSSTRAFASSDDITKRRQTESALRERADFERQLIGIVSHDLRNPLNAILLSATTLHTLARQVVDEVLAAHLRCEGGAWSCSGGRLTGSQGRARGGLR
jgi:signal transduction histidine kinase